MSFPLGLQFHEADQALHRSTGGNKVDQGNGARTGGDRLGAETFGGEILEQTLQCRFRQLIDRAGIAQRELDEVKPRRVAQPFETARQIIIQVFGRPPDKGEV